LGASTAQINRDAPQCGSVTLRHTHRRSVGRALLDAVLELLAGSERKH